MATDTKSQPLYATEAEALKAPGELYRRWTGYVCRVLHKNVATETGEVGVAYEVLWPTCGACFRRPDNFFGFACPGLRNYEPIVAAKAE